MIIIVKVTMPMLKISLISPEEKPTDGFTNLRRKVKLRD